MIFKSFFGCKFRLGLENLHYLFLNEDFLTEPEYTLPLSRGEGIFWDVGCSFGLWSVFWGRNLPGAKVTAFDLSPRAAKFCEKNAKRNGLTNIDVVPKAFTVGVTRYRPPWSGHQENKLDTKRAGTEVSADWRWAAKLFGIPSVLKMDIEGGEEEFLASEGFMNWIRTNDILFLVETHTARAESLALAAGLHKRGNHCWKP